jgi:hypothetical protein
MCQEFGHESLCLFVSVRIDVEPVMCPNHTVALSPAAVQLQLDVGAQRHRIP